MIISTSFSHDFEPLIRGTRCCMSVRTDETVDDEGHWSVQGIDEPVFMYRPAEMSFRRSACLKIPDQAARNLINSTVNLRLQAIVILC